MFTFCSISHFHFLAWSEHLSKVQVMEALQERLLTVDPLTLGGDQCLPLVELKESSNVIDGGRYSKVTMVATVLEVGDLLLFNSFASEAEASRRKTLELAYDYLLELRDLISTFKKGEFYFYFLFLTFSKSQFSLFPL